MHLFEPFSNATAGIFVEYGLPIYASAQRFLGGANGHDTTKPPSHLER